MMVDLSFQMILRIMAPEHLLCVINILKIPYCITTQQYATSFI